MKTYGNDPLECPKCRSKMCWDGIYDGKGENLGIKIREMIEKKTEKEIKELMDMYETIKKLGRGKLEPLFT